MGRKRTAREDLRGSENSFTWEEMSAIVHAIADERVIICGAMLRLKEADKKLKRVQSKLQRIIERDDE